MSVKAITNLEHAIHVTNEWLRELAELGDIETEGHAYSALRAVLHAVRDRLPVDEAAHLAAQLPLIVRGVYYEGWHPAGCPRRDESPEQFLNQIAAELPPSLEISPESALRCVYCLLEGRLSGGQLRHVRAILPRPLLQLIAPDPRAW